MNYLGRPTCYSCLRPQDHCICNLVSSFATHFDVLLLQHPKERRKYYGTAKIINQSVINSRLLIGEGFTKVDILPRNSQGSSYVLFPSATSLTCDQVHLGPNSTLILLDGTWSQARKLMRLTPDLQSLPRISFAKPYSSRYRIRKQPKEGCLSTIEALAYFLYESSLNCDPDEAKSRLEQAYKLLKAFELMVEKQIEYAKRYQFCY